MTHHDHCATTAFRDAMQAMPLVAILRGLAPADAPVIGEALWDAGFRLIEVPLNSPDPFTSIGLLAARLPDCVIGAGTVLDVQDVAAVRGAGGRLIVAPNFDPVVVAACVSSGLPAVPGVATPSEAFDALKAGAAALKLFPAESISPGTLRAWRAVFPPEVALLPVGGIDENRMAEYIRAGASGLGLGSALYRPGDAAGTVAERARRFVAAWHKANGRFSV
jgi:2-dehydro-3-deoxyphosphogalactonate aldolase